MHPRTLSVSMICLAILFLGVSASPPASAAAPRAQPRLGMNLNGPADWNTELPFVDVFRLSRAWISQKQGVGWGKGPPLALDERGWVTRLEANCWAETPLCTVEAGHYPSGRYTVLYDGEGRLEFVHAANRHPRMGEIYRQYYAAWTAAGGDLFCYFSSVGSWSKWGSWGILQFYDDDPLQSPKFVATMRWARQCGQGVKWSGD